jgi:hypothetical protein
MTSTGLANVIFKISIALEISIKKSNVVSVCHTPATKDFIKNG